MNLTSGNLLLQMEMSLMVVWFMLQYFKFYFIRNSRFFFYVKRFEMLDYCVNAIYLMSMESIYEIRLFFASTELQVICMIQYFFKFLVRWKILWHWFLIATLWWFHFDGTVQFARTSSVCWWTRLVIIMVGCAVAFFTRKSLQPIPHFFS